MKAYLFEMPEWTDVSKGVLSEVTWNYYRIPVKDNKVSLQYPWVSGGDGDLKLDIRRFYEGSHGTMVYYDGLSAFRALRSKFARRQPEEIETKKSHTKRMIHTRRGEMTFPVACSAALRPNLNRDSNKNPQRRPAFFSEGESVTFKTN